MVEHPPDVLERALREGDSEALATLFDHYRDQLRRVVAFRLHPRLSGRVDASDVVQQTFLEARTRIHHFIDNASMPFSLWLRHIALQTLVEVHRKHLGVRKRDPRREVSMDQADSNYTAMAERLVANLTSPSNAAVRNERLQRLRDAIDGMDEIDREVLVLRHFEVLSNKEVAETLGIGQPAASNRYIRAVKRLSDILAEQSTPE